MSIDVGRKFVVLSTQRTGSTMLIHLLNSHPAVLCPGEIFFPGSGSEYALNKYVRSSFSRRFRHQVVRPALVREFLDRFFAQEPYQAIGFKYMYSQARHVPRLYPSVPRYIRENKLAIIHGVRRNKLKVLLSRIASKSSGVYRADTPVKKQPIEVPIKGLEGHLEALDREDDIWQRKMAGLPYLRVEYESLLSDRPGEELRLLQFLGVDPSIGLESPFVRMASGPVCKLISNLKEVESVLRGTKFEWCLRD